jgi:O-antigen/teichoic acid export membrane protein
MFTHSTNTAWFFSVLLAVLIFSLSLAGVAWAQGNTSFGTNALQNNITGQFNTAIGNQALFSNSTGSLNTANGVNALHGNTTANFNTETWRQDGRGDAVS